MNHGLNYDAHPAQDWPHPELWPSGMQSSAMSISLEMSDTLQAARLGDDIAFGALVNQYLSSAHRLAQHILLTEEAAADAVQEAFIKVHRALPRFQEGNFRSWLFRIVTNTCYDYLRSQRRRAATSLDELAEKNGQDLPCFRSTSQHDPEVIAAEREGMGYLLEMIDQLPPWHRNVVLLVDVHGYDYGEAAEMLSLPLGTVKSRLSRARSTLRDQLVAAGHMPVRPS